MVFKQHLNFAFPIDSARNPIDLREIALWVESKHLIIVGAIAGVMIIYSMQLQISLAKEQCSKISLLNLLVALYYFLER